MRINNLKVVSIVYLFIVCLLFYSNNAAFARRVRETPVAMPTALPLLVQLSNTNSGVFINGVTYNIPGFNGYFAGQIDDRFGGIYDEKGMLVYKFRLSDDPDVGYIDVVAESRIKTLKPQDRRFKYVEVLGQSQMFHSYTIDDLTSIFDRWEIGYLESKIGLKDDERQHFIDIINFFSESRIGRFVETYRNIDLEAALRFLIEASDPEAALLISEKFTATRGTNSSYSVMGASSDIIKDFKAVSDMAERFGQQFCANTARGSFPAGSEDIADKTFYLSEEIAESVKEAFQLIEIAYKQALKIYESSHDTKWFACVRSAQRDLVSIMCAMMEYGDGLAARGSMGSSFPATDNLRDNMLFYRTDEHKLYIYKVNKWIELTGGQYLAERNYSFIFDSVKTDDAYLDVGVIRDRHQAYIRWNIYTRDSALPALSDKLGVRIDGAYVRQDTRLGTNQFKWKVALDLDSKALNQVFAQVFSLGVDIYEVTNTDHWDGKHHFWLEVFSDHSDINLFGSVTQIYAPILLFTPTTIMTY